MLAFFVRVFWITSVAVLVCMIAAFFSTPDFTDVCTEKLFDCFPVGDEPFSVKLMQVIKCVLNNLVCIGHEFVSIFK